MIERSQGDTCHVQFALFQRFSELVHGSFMRTGGCSPPPFDSLNVSVGAGDEVEHVLSNRLLALRSLGLDGYRCATAWMIHSADVLTLDGDEWEDWRDDWPHRSYLVDGQELNWTMRPRQKADAVITRRRGVTLAMSSADCAPLLLFDPVQQAIGLVHAGWRGTARGIAAIVVDAMREQFGCQPEQIFAGIGPSIGPCCYEVGNEVHRLFLGDTDFEVMPTRGAYRNLVRESAVFTVQAVDDRGTGERQERLRLDLWETNRNQLLLAGLAPDHIEVAGICTSCEKARFFSYRGEHRKTGRFPTLLALRP
ncbi:MAG TPA: peptidoglycan editing factor PgeF [Ktedonobacteraceae bacterium]|nr:peptidoglycan editing factor PgeF [Ktedonobacteraceae bacterium]